VAFDLFRRKMTAANWARQPLTSAPKLPDLQATPNKALEYLAKATEQAKNTDLSLSKSSFKVTRKIAF
jgi:hypothetical protein